MVDKTGGSGGWRRPIIAVGAVASALLLVASAFNFRSGGNETSPAGSTGTVPATADPAPTTGYPTTVALAAEGVAKVAVEPALAGAQIAAPTTTTSTAPAEQVSYPLVTYVENSDPNFSNVIIYLDGNKISTTPERRDFEKTVQTLLLDAAAKSGAGVYKYEIGAQRDNGDKDTTIIQMITDKPEQLAIALVDVLERTTGYKVTIQLGVKPIGPGPDVTEASLAPAARSEAPVRE